MTDNPEVILLPYMESWIGTFIAAVLCISLPETKDKPSAEVVSDTGTGDVIVNEGKDE